MGCVYVGTAGWSIPRSPAARFDSSGTHLERYARAFACAEINSSFDRPHAAATYVKWRNSTPPNFRFAVKVPRTVTHDLKLRRARAPFARFLAETDGLGPKRGPLLVQLPPSLAFDARVVSRFFDVVRSVYDAAVVCEPRHPSWFCPGAEVLLSRFRVARVAADPSPTGAPTAPGGWPGMVYFRLHGSPRTYWSRYDRDYLAPLAAARRSAAQGTEIWYVFDNTASGAAIENAWELKALLECQPQGET